MGFNSAFKGLTYLEPLGPPRPVAGDLYLYVTLLIVIGHVMDRKLDIGILVDNSLGKYMSGTEIKEQFIDMLNSGVYEIRVLLQKDKIYAALNTLYFQVRRTELRKVVWR
jgi:hypothetical protein